MGQLECSCLGHLGDLVRIVLVLLEQGEGGLDLGRL